MSELIGNKLIDRKQNNFNFIRLLAAAGVVITHSYSLLGFPEYDFLYKITHGLLSFSRLGVNTFFIISGFLIAQSLEHSQSFFSFLGKRFLRILPALGVVLILSVLVLGPLVTNLNLQDYFSRYSTWRYLGGITLYKITYTLPGVFVNNPYPNAVNGSLWTLPYEWTCYMVLTCFFILFKNKKYWSLVIFTGLILLFKILFKNWSAVIPVVSLDVKQLVNFSLPFFIGASAYVYRNYLKLSLLGVIISILILYFSFGTKYSGSILYFVLAYIILWVAILPIYGRKFFVNKDYSYGLYIYAFPVQQLLIYYLKDLNIFSLTLLTFICTLPLAILSWHLIEKPVLKLKTKFN